MATKSKTWMETPDTLPEQGRFVFIVTLDSPESFYKIDTKIRVRFFEDGEEHIGENFTMNLDKRSASTQDRKRVIDLFRSLCNSKGQVLIHRDSYNAVLAGVDPTPGMNRLQDPDETPDTLEAVVPQISPEEPTVSTYPETSNETTPAAPLDVNVVIARLLDRAEADKTIILDLNNQLVEVKAAKIQAEDKLIEAAQKDIELTEENKKLKYELDASKLEIEELKLKLADVQNQPTPQLSEENTGRFTALFPEGVR